MCAGEDGDGFGVDEGKYTREQGRAGVTQLLPQAPEGPVLVWRCECRSTGPIGKE